MHGVQASVARRSELDSCNGAAQMMLRANRAGLSVDKYADLASVSADAVRAAAQTALATAVPALAALGKTVNAPTLATVQKLLR